MVVPSGRPFFRRTTMVSPSRARIVGPGNELLTRIKPPFFTAPSGQVAGVTERTTKSCTTSRGAPSAAATTSADDTTVTPAAAVNLQNSLRVRRLFILSTLLREPSERVLARHSGRARGLLDQILG